MSQSFHRFFIIGAPKCGTTSLARWLSGHPEVFIPPVKEPHYFSTDLNNRLVTTRKQYDRLFREVTEAHRVVGEASTWYLFSRDAVPAIEGEFSEPRYIVMTRDSVAMAHSLYHHNVRVLHEDQPTFEAAWRLQRLRAAGRALPSKCIEPAFLQYKAACSLGSLVQRLCQHVPEERILRIPMTHMQSDPGSVYERVLMFLGVVDDGRSEFVRENVARGYRSKVLQRVIRLSGRVRVAFGIERRFGLARLNERIQPKQALSDSFRLELEAAFAEERQKLHELSTENL